MDNDQLHATSFAPVSAAESVQNDAHINDASDAGNSTPPIVPQPSDADSHSQEEDLADILMADIDYSDMPGLREVSDSSDEDSDSDRDANEVEMQAVDNDDAAAPSFGQSWNDLITNLTPASASAFQPPTMARTASPRSNSNRRARVDDDEDEERDRRHPSQRIQSHSNTPTTRSVTSTPLPQNQPGPSSTTLASQPQVGQNLFHTIIPGLFGISGPTDSTSPHTAAHTEGAAAHNPAQGPSTRTFTHRTDDGFMTVEVSTGPIMFGLPMPHSPVPVSQPPPSAEGDAPPGAQQQPQQPQPNPPHGPPGSLTDILARLGVTLGTGGAANLDLGGLGLPLGLFGDLQEKDDPERARKLVDGLEEVPVGLVRRLERVGGSGGGAGEDDGRGGDGMCAICWDRLLDAEGEGFGKEAKKEDRPAEGEASSSSLSTSETKEADSAEKKYPKIVSLPCAHVFHADCLLPWFSRPRHTTCPTCRFNIDPHNLTYVSAARRRQTERDQARGTAGPAPAGNAEVNDTNVDTAPNPSPAAPPTTVEGDAPIPPVNPVNFNVGIGNRG
ncbi:hypothetical protein NLJ89_g10733 [Agrocybe chaxingu]|uniref:RING-type domain-containing protein n=1 Tax=Agrocybe chaxingu TaxID=84603 RepID=A0A9W8JNA9_9AGAR|nr:hypothetical protein NLJ89_g10733 [Agrocybe chaxingu]